MQIVNPNESELDNPLPAEVVNKGWSLLDSLINKIPVIAVIVAIAAVLIYITGFILTVLAPSIHVTNNFLLLGMILLFWLQANKADASRESDRKNQHALEYKLDEIHQTVSALQSMLEKLECAGCDVFPCNCE